LICQPAAILASQFDHISYKAFLVFTGRWNMALCGSVLAKHATGSTFGDAQLVTYAVNTLAATCRA
jgi:hypothetical protein